MRAVLPLLALLTSCSWTAFNDFKSETPMFAISNRAFGAKVAVATDPDGNAIVGSGGLAPQGARFYGVGMGTSEPTGSPLTNSAQCEILADKIAAGGACLSATTLSPAGVLQELDKDTGVLTRVHPGCFTVGYGRRSDSPGVDPGPIVYCTDGGLYTMAPAGDSKLSRAFRDRVEAEIRAQRVAMATTLHDGKSLNPGMVVASNVDERAWVYPTIRSQLAPIEITEAAATEGDKYGSAVAVARSKVGPLYLVSAPGIGKIFGWTVDIAKNEATRVACIEGPQGTGETLVTADFDGDGEDDIFVNEGSDVKMYLGSQRPAPAASPADPCPKWPAARMTLKCEDTMGATGCTQSGFGSSIAVGDFDKDGKKEVAVGAPFAITDGVGSGAVYLYTPTLDGPNPVLDVRYLASPQNNAAFGTSVASGRIGTQDTLVVGAAGKAVTYIVWCTALPGAPRSGRCRK